MIEPHEWLSLTEGPVIDLDVLPPGQAVAAGRAPAAADERGERVDLRSGTGLTRVWQERNKISPGSYGFTAVQDGSLCWRMQVLRRPPAS